MLIVLLAGGIASGKSEASRVFQESGYRVFLTDAQVRKLLSPGSRVLDEIVKSLGKDILLPDRSLNRRALARKIFFDRAALEAVNSIVHPEALKLAMEEIQEAAHAEEKLMVIEDPLLYANRNLKSHQKKMRIVTVAVEAPFEDRAARLEKKGMSFPEILARMGSGPDDWEYLAAADHVVRNDSTLEDLRARVLDLLRTLTVNS